MDKKARLEAWIRAYHTKDIPCETYHHAETDLACMEALESLPRYPTEQLHHKTSTTKERQPCGTGAVLIDQRQ